MTPDSDNEEDVPRVADGTGVPTGAQLGEASRRWPYRARAADHRAPTDYVQFKLRIRAPLVKKLQKEADKKKQSANIEAVQRLEQSFANEVQGTRDSETLNLMLGLVAGNSDMRDTFAAIIRALGNLKAVDSGEIAKRVRDLIETYQPEGGSVAVGTTISAAALADRAKEIAGTMNLKLEPSNKREREAATVSEKERSE